MHIHMHTCAHAYMHTHKHRHTQTLYRHHSTGLLCTVLDYLIVLLAKAGMALPRSPFSKGFWVTVGQKRNLQKVKPSWTLKVVSTLVELSFQQSPLTCPPLLPTATPGLPPDVVERQWLCRSSGCPHLSAQPLCKLLTAGHVSFSELP